jgi:hypothetical protein
MIHDQFHFVLLSLDDVNQIVNREPVVHAVSVKSQQ